ncbi:hypothetical protein CVT26_013693 [Gymnopilus dilepis]|uniref:Uncharacterized protein n=1 Tax=Gymnopilus dilepis TaxID=231916 RepID=A0A409YWH8_9AGAR|nr:hypothetical protein CVT26_013693 [Gymnopilus dilepis]
MILRSRRCYDILFLFAYLLVDLPPLTAADPSFDCRVAVGNTKFDLQPLAGEHVVNRTRQLPPTTMVDSLRFNLCADLTSQEGLPEQDQCPPGTRACLLKINQKENELDRIIAVIPVAQTSTLEPMFSASLSPKHLLLQLRGAEYPSSSDTLLVRQTLNLTLSCDPQATSDPEFVGYDGSILDLKWNSRAGCPLQEDDDGKDKEGNNDGHADDGKASVGSGIGWFFLVLLLAFFAYFGLGAYYNYSTYGATGYDLIPHRDFWKEVPYMLSDVVSHLCSDVRSRRTASRGGYISV